MYKRKKILKIRKSMIVWNKITACNMTAQKTRCSYRQPSSLHARNLQGVHHTHLRQNKKKYVSEILINFLFILHF